MASNQRTQRTQRSERSDRELRNALNDLYYEFWMFAKLANGLASGIMGESILNNALLESFAVHAQVVLDFLYNDRPAEDDVSAVDYVPSPGDWVRVRPEKSATLQDVEADIRHRVRREIAHLAYDRHEGAPERKPWPFMRIAKELSAAVDAFLEQVPERLLGPRWQEVKQHRRVQNGAG